MNYGKIRFFNDFGGNLVVNYIFETVKNRAGDTKIPCPIALHTFNIIRHMCSDIQVFVEFFQSILTGAVTAMLN